MATARTRGRGDADVADGRQSSDAYVGMLLVSLIAMIIGCVLLYLDFAQYPEAKAPNPPASTPPQRSAPPADTPPPPPGGGGQPGQTNPGGNPAPGTPPNPTNTNTPPMPPNM